MSTPLIDNPPLLTFSPRSQVAGLSPRLEAVCLEVQDTTNFKPFILFGGPNPKGTGGIQIFQYVSTAVCQGVPL